MAVIIRAGEEIVCPKGDICGHVRVDLAADAINKVPELGPASVSPFSMDCDRTKLGNDGYCCKDCCEPVALLRNGAYQIRTKGHGWIGRPE